LVRPFTHSERHTEQLSSSVTCKNFILKLIYVLQLLNYVRPYGNQSNEDATYVTCGTKVGEEKFLERLVERDYLLDLSVSKKETFFNPMTYAFISRGIILLRTEYTKVSLVVVSND